MKRRELLKFLGYAAPALALGSPPAKAQTTSQTAAERAAGVVPVNEAHPPLNVLRYGAVGNGLTDDRAAIKAAWQVARQQGGGTIVFPNGATYLVSSLDPASPVKVPQQQSDGSIKYLPYQTQLYLQDGSNIVLDFQGSLLKTSLTGGGVFMLFDGCTNIRMLQPKIAGTQLQSTGVVAFGAITGGSGYRNGTYKAVLLTGGSGGGAVADVVVEGGAVSSLEMVYPGGSYVVGDKLSCANASIGGTGNGFSVAVASISGAGPKVAVAAPIAIAFTALARSASNITVTDLQVRNMYAGFWVLGDPGTQNTITHVNLLGHTQILNGEYGVAFHNTGDDTVIENLYTYRLNRPFFIYGVQNVTVNCTADQTNHGFQPVVKAYSRSSRNIAIKYEAINQPGQSNAVSKISFQVQHDPAVVNPPPTVQGVTLEYGETNVSSGGNGIEFDYFSGPGGTTLQSSSANPLFDNFVIRGSMRNTVMTTVALTGARCRINLDHISAARPRPGNELESNGFAR
jgi:pectate lyase-like protein